MKHKTVYLLCGPAGCGKSTYAKEQIRLNEQRDAIIISRDDIRFSLLGEDDDYFTHENEVFDIFIKLINRFIKDEEHDIIYIDATHLTPKSRSKVLNKLHLVNCDIIPISFIASLETILARNAARGGRARVPDSAVGRMFSSYIPPTLNEHPLFKEIITIKE